jgi:hypothetical protein
VRKFLNVLLLPGRVEVGRFRPFATLGAEGKVIGNLLSPIFEENLELALTLRMRTSPIKIALVIERQIDRDRHGLLESLELADKLIEHFELVLLVRRRRRIVAVTILVSDLSVWSANHQLTLVLLCESLPRIDRCPLSEVCRCRCGAPLGLNAPLVAARHDVNVLLCHDNTP